MEMLNAVLTALLVGLALTLFLAAWAATVLRRRYPKTWEQVGGPGLGRLGLQSHLDYLRFWWSGEYRSLGDGKIDGLAIALLITFFLSVGLILFTGLALFWSMLVTT